MTIHQRGEWTYDHNVTAWEGKFFWTVVRLKLDPRRDIQVVVGSWVAGWTAATREETERDAVAAIDHHSEHSV